jgi:hypothetical protein
VGDKMKHKRNNIFDLLWETFSGEEKKTFALLSMPFWFDTELAILLLEKFNHQTLRHFNALKKEPMFLFIYEDKGWYYEESFRAYLLEKAGAMFQQSKDDIHRFLAGHYRKKKNGGHGPANWGLGYLALYHQFHLDTEGTLTTFLKELRHMDGTEKYCALKSMIKMLKGAGEHSLYTVLIRFLESFYLTLEQSAGIVSSQDNRHRLAEATQLLMEHVTAPALQELVREILDSLPQPTHTPSPFRWGTPVVVNTGDKRKNERKIMVYQGEQDRMQNITAMPVEGPDFCEQRQELVEELRHLLHTHSVIIAAPPKSGKTSLIRELMRQEYHKIKSQREFEIILVRLDREDTINGFFFNILKSLVSFYYFQKKETILRQMAAELWGECLSSGDGRGAGLFDSDLRRKTRGYNISIWMEKLTPIFAALNSFKTKIVVVFDDFPAMIYNIREKMRDEERFNADAYHLLSWLQGIRQTHQVQSRSRFLLCGSSNPGQTPGVPGISETMNDLLPLKIPPLGYNESWELIKALSVRYHVTIEPEGILFLTLKLVGSSLYFVQIIFRTIKNTNTKTVSTSNAKEIYWSVVREHDNSLEHSYKKLASRIPSFDLKWTRKILERLSCGDIGEKELYHLLLCNKCSYEQYRTTIDHLIDMGYITRDLFKNGNLRFSSHLFKDWWEHKSKKKEQNDVCL